ncbi:hypothetical protein SASPL_110646 [Salvia splendens]|uniref:Uncharacterized protein n=1 Tax=Salvia splendens TaxID=180675 RepID=A0A8X8YAW9_SALSN|nr:hypothetical protein SASPL_110646 [Salvia splendens]
MQNLEFGGESAGTDTDEDVVITGNQEEGGATSSQHTQNTVALLDNLKCRKSIISADESIGNGECIVFCRCMDDLSHLRAPASEFGLIFCSKLDTERANDSSEEELSTLDQSDHKKIRERKPFLAQITQKQDLSSRQTPFNSPNHLSANIGDQQQTNGEKQGIRASNSSSHPSDKDVSCLSTKNCKSVTGKVALIVYIYITPEGTL